MSSETGFIPLEGGCDCGASARHSGSSYALNAMIESSNVKLSTPIAPEMVPLPSESGKPQIVARCPTCKIAVWSNYGGSADNFRFVKVGSLDDPDKCAPNIQIYTAFKQPWVKLNDQIPAVDEYYERKDYWPQECLERLERAVAESKAKQGDDDDLASKTENIKL